MITTLHYKAPNPSQERILLIMLPGVGGQAGEFAAHGMVDAVHARGLAVDVIAVQPELELYLDGHIASALHGAVVEPALRQGYARIWLLGISLGGMGALLYASAHPAQVDGLVLLAPFLGTRGTVAEVEKAGGLASWPAAQSAATEVELRMLVWLQNFRTRPADSPVIYLAYGRQDRFAQGHQILAEILPKDRVVTKAGGHDWETWLTLWQRVLASSPFTGNLQ